MFESLVFLVALAPDIGAPLEVSPIERVRLSTRLLSDHSHGCLDDDRIELLRLQAVAGHSRSAYELAMHHVYCEHGDVRNYLFFLRLAAEQGNCDALDEFAQQQRRDYPEALKAPGDWRARARQCDRSAADSED